LDVNFTHFSLRLGVAGRRSVLRDFLVAVSKCDIRPIAGAVYARVCFNRSLYANFQWRIRPAHRKAVGCGGR
jgi:hypothetical protein